MLYYILIMVRFKNRYFVMEIVTPGDVLRESHTEADLLQVVLANPRTSGRQSKRQWENSSWQNSWLL